MTRGPEAMFGDRRGWGELCRAGATQDRERAELGGCLGARDRCSVVYLLWSDDLTWLLALLLLVPLLALIVWRHEQHGEVAGGLPPNADGPWAPPGDGGG
jgi:hypothetical protein